MNYKVYLSTKVNPSKLAKGSGIIVLEPEDYTIDQVKAIKTKGYKVLAYLSIGTIEKERSWWSLYSKYKLKRLPDWPKEYYIDIAKTQWRKFLIGKAREYKACGYSGWWLDNLDVYSEYKSNKNFNAMYGILQDIKANKGYVMVNGGSEWLDDLMDRKYNPARFIDGYTQEEVFSRIKDYAGSGKFGKQVAADTKFYKSLIRKLEKKKVNCFFLEYTRDNKLKAIIKEWCKKNKVDYYIAEDVNL